MDRDPAPTVESIEAALQADEPAVAVELFACLSPGGGEHASVLRLVHRAAELRGGDMVVRAALGWFDRSAAQNERNADFHRSRGRALQAGGHNAEAIAVFRDAVRLDPGLRGGWSDLGWALRYAGDLEGGIEAFRRRVELDPDDANSRLQLFAGLHRAGHWEEGWPEYEWRLRTEGAPEPLPGPEWKGGPLDGMRLLVRAEQGLGDQIFFLRYIPLLAERGARITVRCHPVLARLARSCPGVEHVVDADEEETPEHDAWVWSGSLPLRFGTTLRSVPAPHSYLRADEGQVRRWRKLLGHLGGMRVGINWEGNRANTAGRNRAIPLDCFLTLASVPGVRLFSIQKGYGEEALARLPEGFQLPHLGQFFLDLWDAAAVIAVLDMVITNDTSVAHLAGALGKPVWIVLPPDCCWRWQEDREDSPWYPSARLFRARSSDSWADAFARVRADLAAATALPASA